MICDLEQDRGTCICVCSSTSQLRVGSGTVCMTVNSDRTCSTQLGSLYLELASILASGAIKTLAQLAIKRHRLYYMHNITCAQSIGYSSVAK